MRFMGIRFPRKPSVISTEGDAHRAFGRRLDPENVLLVECARGHQHDWYGGRFGPEIAAYMRTHGCDPSECMRFVLP